MILGINYADPSHFGWDFGPPPRNLAGQYFGGPNWAGPAGSGGLPPLLTRLQNYRALGLQIVRFPILGDAWNCGTPKAEWSGSDWKWTYAPPSLDPSFIQNFELLLQTFQQVADVKLMPTFVSFEAFQHGKLVLNGSEFPLDSKSPPAKGRSIDDFIDGRFLRPGEQSTFRTPKLRLDPERSTDYNAFIKGGKADVILDPNTRKAFLDQVLQPFLRMAYNYRDQIFAFDLFNEPDMLKAELPEDKLIQFLNDGCGLIARYGLRSTVGFQRFEDLDQWQVPTALKQFHYYPEKDIGLDLAELGGGCLGEFATADADPKTGKPWPGWTSNKAAPRPPLDDRLRIIEGKKFSYALLWSDDAKDDVTTWIPSTWTAIGDYLGINASSSP